MTASTGGPPVPAAEPAAFARPDRRARLLDAVGLLVRLGLAAVWWISGVAKAIDPAGTIVSVRAYRLLPESGVQVVGVVLPYLEIAVGLLLVLGLATRLAAILSAVLLVAFLIGVISAAARGLSIDCGCFGGGGAVAPGETRYAEEIVRDLGFLAMAAFLVIRPDTPLSVDRLVSRRAGDRHS